MREEGRERRERQEKGVGFRGDWTCNVLFRPYWRY